MESTNTQYSHFEILEATCPTTSEAGKRTYGTRLPAVGWTKTRRLEHETSQEVLIWHWLGHRMGRNAKPVKIRTDRRPRVDMLDDHTWAVRCKLVVSAHSNMSPLWIPITVALVRVRFLVEPGWSVCPICGNLQRRTIASRGFCCAARADALNLPSGVI